MNVRWIGAILIIVGCGGVGFGMALNYKREEAILEQLIKTLDYMRCELEYRMTSLPELCKKAANFSSGCIKAVFTQLGMELDAQIAPDAACCMSAVLKRSSSIPEKVASALAELGRSLGQFDLDGQLRGLSVVVRSCEKELEQLQANHPQRVRSYQTLGLCAGAALAILFV